MIDDLTLGPERPYLSPFGGCSTRCTVSRDGVVIGELERTDPADDQPRQWWLRPRGSPWFFPPMTRRRTRTDALEALVAAVSAPPSYRHPSPPEAREKQKAEETP